MKSINGEMEEVVMGKQKIDEQQELHGFLTGENFYVQQILGLHEEDGKYVFRVWAPNAQKVWLVGDFNDWENTLLMEQDRDSGVWLIETTLPKQGDLYKFNVQRTDGTQIMKLDPFATRFETRPGTAAVIQSMGDKKWRDGLWRGRQKRSNHLKRPINIYEVHASSWRQKETGEPYTFHELKEHLIPYVKKMQYTHVEFMPLMEHPLGASWGYQLTGFFALASYYGTPEDFQEFVEACHLANIGVIVDWVPGHFCANEDTLPYYDGTPTFEYADSNRAKNRRWGVHNFDLGKPQVQSFLISSALYWIDTFHLDGIRVDAVSNMLYLDYDEGPWTPNHEGGNRNFEGYYFLQKLSSVLKQKHPNILLIAEESTSQTQITGPITTGALGFDYKWNMGWMNDILRFYQMDPIERKHHFHLVTFSFMYAFNENYLLALSHDEVVHGKKSLMHKMWGDRYKQFSQLRNLYAFMYAHPGKKLLFMGGEWGQFLEWKHDQGLEWVDLQDSFNYQMQIYTKHLNHLYKEQRALWEMEDSSTTIRWIDDSPEDSILAFIRQGHRKKDFLIIIVNLVPVERVNYPIAVPYEGEYEEILNTERATFGGTWEEGNPVCETTEQTMNAFSYQITPTIPALGVLYLRPKKIQIRKTEVKGGKEL